MIQINPQAQQNFYTDIINAAVFNTPVPFLKKYPTIQHYQQILTNQQKILDILYQIVGSEMRGEGLMESIENHFSQTGYDASMFYKIIKGKYSQIKKQLIKRQISLGSCTLAGHNWKLKNVIASHSHTHKTKMIICLTLYTVEGEGLVEKEEKVDFQLTIPETKQLLLRLKELKNEMKSEKF